MPTRLPHLASAAARRARRLVGGRRPPWVVQEPAPPEAEPLADVRLFGIIGTWMEADVIEATVRNAFTQGCERVYLVDNDSPDDTVARAVAAGAEVGRVFSSSTFTPSGRFEIMNDVVAEVSSETGDEHLWWLWMDADEFCHGPSGSTILEHVRALDRRFRIVGSHTFTHFPSTRPQVLRGLHPIDFQPLCQDWPGETCQAGHWKHSLQRFDRAGPELRCRMGSHTASSPERPLREPEEPIVMHHFQWRDEATTRARLRRLCTPDEQGHVRLADPQRAMSKRFQSLDAVYGGRWQDTGSLTLKNLAITIEPRPWTEVVPLEHQAFARWYSPDELARARAADSPDTV